MVTKKATAKKPPAATPAKPDTNGYKIKAEEWGFTKGDTDSQAVSYTHLTLPTSDLV